MKEIKLTNGEIVKVDDEDFERVSKFSWNSNGRYAKRTVRESDIYKTILMHVYIMNTPKGMVTDHINGDPLDNRRSNLRICSQKQNLLNSKPLKSNESGYKGVTWHTPRNKWRVRVKREYVGLYNSKEEAAKAYNKKAIEIYGEYAYLNDV